MVNVISYGIISTHHNAAKRVAAAIDNIIIDLAELCKHDILDKRFEPYFLVSNLHGLMKLTLRDKAEIKTEVLNYVKIHGSNIKSAITHHMPIQIGGYTDFFASRNHATNIGKLINPATPLFPNWLNLPIAYNGRASTVVISGHPLKRPHGQILVKGTPEFSLVQKIDFEVELGMVIGKDSKLGEPIDVNNADEYIFGICVVNDWSIRDMQLLESQPLGPFTSKNILTSISPFIIPLEELEPFKTPLPDQVNKPFAYLEDKAPYTYDIKFDVKLKTNKAEEAYKISEVNFQDIYWSMKQMIAQHTVSGCNLKMGDLIASGTISSDEQKNTGSLMELTRDGQDPLILPSGDKRTFLEDGDEVIIEAYNNNYGRTVQLGNVIGRVTS